MVTASRICSTAWVAAELGGLAWEIAYERWTDLADGDDFSELARRALGELQAASACADPGPRVCRLRNRRALGVHAKHPTRRLTIEATYDL